MLDYKLVGKVGVIGLDDGKANAVGHNFVDAMNEGLDRAEAEASGVLITGRPGLFSAGFDLKEFENGPEATSALVNKGAHMLLRLFRHPQPVVVACAGHAVAAGAFTLLACDVRIGAEGDFKIGLNETAIGMSLPVFGIQLASARLSKRWQTQCVVQAQMLSPEEAQNAGFLDQVVAPDALIDTALSTATTLAELPTPAYAFNKRALREPYIKIIEDSLA
ncbi:MAG: crotonase/enoyl-CoA hydratase family protein [Pseudomonadota bacterium]